MRLFIIDIFYTFINLTPKNTKVSKIWRYACNLIWNIKPLESGVDYSIAQANDNNQN